jgi:hypothetical protein
MSISIYIYQSVFCFEENMPIRTPTSSTERVCTSLFFRDYCDIYIYSYRPVPRVECNYCHREYRISNIENHEVYRENPFFHRFIHFSFSSVHVHQNLYLLVLGHLQGMQIMTFSNTLKIIRLLFFTS